MEKITEIDIALREDIENGKQGNGVYFITSKTQDAVFGTGGIKPCSPDKIKISDVILLKGHRRILPVGFTPNVKAEYKIANESIEKLLRATEKVDENTYRMNISEAEVIISKMYNTIIKDENEPGFIGFEEYTTSLRYFCRTSDTVWFTVYRNMAVSKYKRDGVKLQDSPDTAKTHLAKAKILADNSPCVMAFQENGEDDSWKNRPFWWPVLVAPRNAHKAIYAAKIAGEKIVFQEK